jgi:hypothetical protein
VTGLGADVEVRERAGAAVDGQLVRHRTCAGGEPTRRRPPGHRTGDSATTALEHGSGIPSITGTYM